MRITAFLAVVFAAAPAFAQQGKVAWEPTIDDAIKAGEKTGKPILLFFGCN